MELANQLEDLIRANGVRFFLAQSAMALTAIKLTRDDVCDITETADFRTVAMAVSALALSAAAFRLDNSPIRRPGTVPSWGPTPRRFWLTTDTGGPSGDRDDRLSYHGTLAEAEAAAIAHFKATGGNTQIYDAEATGTMTRWWAVIGGVMKAE